MEYCDLIKARRSVRKYAAKEVTTGQIEELVKAAQMAPSWKNRQTGRYYAVTGVSLDEIREEILPPFNQKNSANAALIVTTFVKGRSGFNGDVPENELGDQWGAYDLGLQNAYLILKATDMGLDTLIMGIRDADAIRKRFDIPENEAVVSVISVGYRDCEPALPARKELGEILKFAE